MKLLSVVFYFLALLSTLGCSRKPSPAESEVASYALKAGCPLSFYEVSDSGKLASQPFIRPNDVARLDTAQKLFPEDVPAMFVTLTPQGEHRMLIHTSNNKNRTIAAFCGDTEVYRAAVFKPFSNHFRVPLHKPDGT